jgi:hypothetical protein
VDSPVWVVRNAQTPEELEVLLNLLSEDGYEIWSITDRLTQYVVIAYNAEEE